MRTDAGQLGWIVGQQVARSALATSTALAPAWRKTARTTVAVGTSLAAHPEAHVDALVLHRVARRRRRPAGRPARRRACAMIRLLYWLGASRAGPAGWSRNVPVGAVELAGALVAGAAADGGGQVVDRDAARRQRRRVGLDADGGLRAVDAHLAHAGRMLMRWPTCVLAVVVELPVRHRVAGQRDVHDRLVVRVRLGERRRAGQVDREAAGRLRDRGLHVGRRGVDALVQDELERQARSAPGVLLLRDDLEPGDLHELALERRGDVVRHRLRAGAGVADAAPG